MEEKKSYYAIIPANVRYDKSLPPNAKLLYGEITALCNERGYCWAENRYFAELYGVSKTSISKWISALAENGYIKVELTYKAGSKEIDNRYITIVSCPIEKKLNTPTTKVDSPIEKKLKDNNTDNNTLNNTFNKDIGEEPKRKRFVPPTLEEVKAYCIERNNNVDAQRFIDYYTSNGWLVGKNKMKDWKAAVRTWERNGYSKKETQNSSYDTNEFYEAALQASERQYAQLAKNPRGKRAAVDRGVIDRMDEKAQNPPKTAADDEEIRERMERLKKSLNS